MTNTTIGFLAPSDWSTYNKVQVIKAIRMVTRCSLVEAKNMSENTSQQQLEISNSATQAELDDSYQFMRINGCEVGPAYHRILKELRVLASQALGQGDDELANEILQLVLAEKLRRQP